MQFKLGKQPYKHNPRTPLLRTLAPAPLLPPPTEGDNFAALPSFLGVMLNDQYGCCTISGFYHLLQVWTGNANPPMDTEPDANVLSVYEGACGFAPSDPSTDRGGDMQEVLQYLATTGYPTKDGIKRIDGYCRSDPKNIDDLKRIVTDFGAAYIGFSDLPQSVLQNASDPTKPWDYKTGEPTVGEGHCVILGAYKDEAFWISSWGTKYPVTLAFLNQFLDEMYGVFDNSWVEKSGKTPIGMDSAAVNQAMNQLGIL